MTEAEMKEAIETCKVIFANASNETSATVDIVFYGTEGCEYINYGQLLNIANALIQSEKENATLKEKLRKAIVSLRDIEMKILKEIGGIDGK